MKTRSQEKLLYFKNFRRSNACGKFLWTAGLACLISLSTAYGASADPFDDLMTRDDKSGSGVSDGSDVQSRMDLRKDDRRELKDMRARRDAKKALLDKQARDARSLYDLNDGSQYGKHSFMDTYFGKQSYTDLKSSKPDGDRPDDTSVITKDVDDKSDGDKRDDDKRADDVFRRAKLRRDQREKDRDMKVWMHLMKPNPDALHDWVPRAADPIHNGGFERESDNGSPVPYHLNGHPDFQRGLPWAEGE